MDRIIIHELRRYKLVFISEKTVKTSSNNKDKLESGSGFDNKVGDILYQDPSVGWKSVVNPEVAFTIADNNHVKISKDYLKRINPSESFFEKRRKKDDPDTKKKKRR